MSGSKVRLRDQVYFPVYVRLKIYGSNRSLQILNIKPFEGAQKNPHWRKTSQLLTVWLQMLNVCVGTSYKDI